MLMIPLPIVIALCALAFAVFELSQRGLARRNGWLMAFLAVFSLQETLVGLRFGYGFDALKQIQPLSASLIPPLAYLSFRRPAFLPALSVLVGPLVAVVLVLVIWFELIDTVLALAGVIYAALLARLGLRGSDALGWVGTHRSQSVLVLVWIVVAVLLVSCLTDAAIAYDFWVTQGNNTARIAGWTSGVALLGVGIAIAALTLRKPAAPVAQESVKTTGDFAALTALMAREKLHLDPDINLNRMARRLTLPVRDVSRAINAEAGCNVSQYINRLRVEEACALLQDTDMAVTQIIYAAGFNTKSNFNREFARNTGQSPSAWRAARGSDA